VIEARHIGHHVKVNGQEDNENDTQEGTQKAAATRKKRHDANENQLTNAEIKLNDTNQQKQE
jgi:hypothetical protein